MRLCLDVGNTHILGGIFEKDHLITRFRYATHLIGTADQFGIFLINFLQSKNIESKHIAHIAVCSVVPSGDFTLKHAFALYFPNADIFMLQPSPHYGLTIKYKNPNEVGADLIAGALGAIHTFPNQNIIIIDLGTATTLTAITKNKEFLGGTILPGIRVCMEALTRNAAKLMEVDIASPTSYLGSTTKECMQTGLFYGHLGAMKEIVSGFKNEIFKNDSVTVIGTGGFAQLFKDQALFNIILPDLVLQGLNVAYEASRGAIGGALGA